VEHPAIAAYQAVKPSETAVRVAKLRLQVEQLDTEGTELRTQVASMQQHQQRIEQELQDHRQQLAAYQQRWQTLAQPLSLAFTLIEPDALA
ncbi:hypothetical protein GFJ91_23645, partial [Salmonella enterica subsp. enterica serovar Enteritidis]|nr:hypothetical protein [Salmonella enterica subsp. enterica serovar Enteritidis]